MTSVFMPYGAVQIIFIFVPLLSGVVGVISRIGPVCMGMRRTFGADADSLNTVDGEVSDKTTYFVWKDVRSVPWRRPNDTQMAEGQGLEQKAIAARALSLTAFCFVPPSASHTWCIWFACSARPVASREGRVN
jgi:hypothetical protein